MAGAGGGGQVLGGVGGEGWAWIGARKTLLFMAGALEGGGQVRAVGAVRSLGAAFHGRGAAGGGGKCERWGR